MAEILIYGDIGWENTAKSVEEQLQRAGGEPITVRINSGGGDVYEGVAVLNALRRYEGEVTTVIESLAASAASFIAVGAGGRVVIRPNAEVMVHKAWTMMMGNADEIDKIKADLARQDLKIARIYAARAGGELDDWLTRMANETWYNADEALAAGLVDEIEDALRDPVPAENAAGPKVFAKFRYPSRAAAPPPPVARSVSGDTTDKPGDGQEGDTMSILNQLVNELKSASAEDRKVLAGFFNEAVEITTPVTVEYPDEVEVVPTGKVVVTPTTPLPEGVVPEVEVGEGFTAEVAEDGTITVRATDGVSVDATADLTIKFGDTELHVGVKVVAVDNGDDDTPETPDSPEAPEGGRPGSGGPAEFSEDRVTLDSETYAELKAAAQHGWTAMEAEKEAKLVEEVDQWIKQGRISSSRREKAVAAMKRDPQIARDLYGSNPKDSVPRREIGYGTDPVDPEAGDEKTADDLIARANAKKNNR